MQRVCVFVDGENFRHAICELFAGQYDRREYLPKQAEWGNFFNWLVEKACGTDSIRLRTYWYVVEHIDFFPYTFPSLPDKSMELKRLLAKNEIIRQELENLSSTALLNQRMSAKVEELLEVRRKMEQRFRGWRTVQDGIATGHEAIEFRRAGAIAYNLFDESLGQEKAVDVKLACDLIVLRDIYDVAVILSGDQDYVPAVQWVKDCGKRTVNVAFSTRGGKMLPGGSRRLNIATDKSLKVAYADLNKWLKISPVSGKEKPSGTTLSSDGSISSVSPTLELPVT